MNRWHVGVVIAIFACVAIGVSHAETPIALPTINVLPADQICAPKEIPYGATYKGKKNVCGKDCTEAEDRPWTKSLTLQSPPGSEKTAGVCGCVSYKDKSGAWKEPCPSKKYRAPGTGAGGDSSAATKTPTDDPKTKQTQTPKTDSAAASKTDSATTPKTGTSETAPKTGAETQTPSSGGGAGSAGGGSGSGSGGGQTSSPPMQQQSQTSPLSSMYEKTPLSQQPTMKEPVILDQLPKEVYDPNAGAVANTNFNTPPASALPGASSQPVQPVSFQGSTIGSIPQQPPADHFAGSVTDRPTSYDSFAYDSTFSQTYQQPAAQSGCSGLASCAWDSTKSAASAAWDVLSAPPASSQTSSGTTGQCPGNPGCPGNTVDDAATRGADLARAYNENREAMRNSVNERGKELVKAVDDLTAFDKAVQQTYPTFAQGDQNIAKEIAADRAPLEAAAKEAKQVYDAAKASYDGTFGSQNPFNEAQANLGKQIAQQDVLTNCPAGTCPLNGTQREYGLAANYLTYDTPQAIEAAKAMGTSIDCNSNPAQCAAQYDAVKQAAKTNELYFPPQAPDTFNPLDPRWYYAGSGETANEAAKREAARTASSDKLSELSRIASGDLPVSSASSDTQSVLATQTKPASGFWPTVNKYANGLTQSMTKEFGKAGENIASFATFPVTAVNDAALAAFGPTTDQQRIQSYFQTSYENALDRVNAVGKTTLVGLGLTGGLSPRDLVPRLNPVETFGGSGAGARSLASGQEITPAQVNAAFKPVSGISGTSPVRSIEVIPKSEVTSAMQGAMAKTAAPAGSKYVYGSMPAGGKIPNSYAYGGIQDAMRTPAGEGGMLVRAAVPDAAAGSLAKGSKLMSANEYIQRGYSDAKTGAGVNQTAYVYPKEWFPEQAVGTKPALAGAPAAKTGLSLADRKLVNDAAIRAQTDWTGVQAAYDASRPFTDPAAAFTRSEAAHIARINGDSTGAPRAVSPSVETAIKVTGAGLQLGNMTPALATEARAVLPSALERPAYMQTINQAALNDPALFRSTSLAESPSAVSPAFRAPVGDLGGATALPGASSGFASGVAAPLSQSFAAGLDRPASVPPVTSSDFGSASGPAASAAPTAPAPLASSQQPQSGTAVPGVSPAGPTAAVPSSAGAPASPAAPSAPSTAAPAAPSTAAVSSAPATAGMPAAPSATAPAVSGAPSAAPTAPSTVTPSTPAPTVAPSKPVPLPPTRPASFSVASTPAPAAAPSTQTAPAAPAARTERPPQVAPTPAPQTVTNTVAPSSPFENFADAFTSLPSLFSIGGAQAAQNQELTYSPYARTPEQYREDGEAINEEFFRQGYTPDSDPLHDPAARVAYAEAYVKVNGAKKLLNQTMYRDSADAVAVIDALRAGEWHGLPTGTLFPISSSNAYGEGQLKEQTATAVGSPDADTNPIQYVRAMLNVMNANADQVAAQHPGLTREQARARAATHYNVGPTNPIQVSNRYGTTFSKAADAFADMIRDTSKPAPSMADIIAQNPRNLGAEGADTIRTNIAYARTVPVRTPSGETAPYAIANTAARPANVQTAGVDPATPAPTVVAKAPTTPAQPAPPTAPTAARPAAVAPAPAPAAQQQAPSPGNPIASVLGTIADAIRSVFSAITGAQQPTAPTAAPGRVDAAPTGPTRTVARVEPELMRIINPSQFAQRQPVKPPDPIVLATINDGTEALADVFGIPAADVPAHAQAIAAVGKVESQLRADTPHPGNPYQGASQTDRIGEAENIWYLTEMRNRIKSGALKVSPLTEQRIERWYQRSQELMREGKDTRMDPELGGLWLVMQQANLTRQGNFTPTSVLGQAYNQLVKDYRASWKNKQEMSVTAIHERLEQLRGLGLDPLGGLRGMEVGAVFARDADGVIDPFKEANVLMATQLFPDGVKAYRDNQNAAVGKDGAGYLTHNKVNVGANDPISKAFEQLGKQPSYQAHFRAGIAAEAPYTTEPTSAFKYAFAGLGGQQFTVGDQVLAYLPGEAIEMGEPLASLEREFSPGWAEPQVPAFAANETPAPVEVADTLPPPEPIEIPAPPIIVIEPDTTPGPRDFADGTQLRPDGTAIPAQPSVYDAFRRGIGLSSPAPAAPSGPAFTVDSPSPVTQPQSLGEAVRDLNTIQDQFAVFRSADAQQASRQMAESARSFADSLYDRAQQNPTATLGAQNDQRISPNLEAYFAGSLKLQAPAPAPVAAVPAQSVEVADTLPPPEPIEIPAPPIVVIEPDTTPGPRDFADGTQLRPDGTAVPAQPSIYDSFRRGIGLSAPTPAAPSGPAFIAQNPSPVTQPRTPDTQLTQDTFAVFKSADLQQASRDLAAAQRNLDNSLYRRAQNQPPVTAQTISPDLMRQFQTDLSLRPIAAAPAQPAPSQPNTTPVAPAQPAPGPRDFAGRTQLRPDGTAVPAQPSIYDSFRRGIGLSAPAPAAPSRPAFIVQNPSPVTQTQSLGQAVDKLNTTQDEFAVFHGADNVQAARDAAAKARNFANSLYNTAPQVAVRPLSPELLREFQFDRSLSLLVDEAPPAVFEEPPAPTPGILVIAPESVLETPAPAQQTPPAPGPRDFAGATQVSPQGTPLASDQAAWGRLDVAPPQQGVTVAASPAQLEAATEAEQMSPAPSASASSRESVRFDTNLGFGSRGESVVQLQQRLIDSGDLRLVHGPSGYFGPLTQRAVIRYQAEHGILQTGYVGNVTRGALNAAPTRTIEAGSPVQTAPAPRQQQAVTPVITPGESLISSMVAARLPATAVAYEPGRLDMLLPLSTAPTGPPTGVVPAAEALEAKASHVRTALAALADSGSGLQSAANVTQARKALSELAVRVAAVDAAMQTLAADPSLRGTAAEAAIAQERQDLNKGFAGLQGAMNKVFRAAGALQGIEKAGAALRGVQAKSTDAARLAALTSGMTSLKNAVAASETRLRALGDDAGIAEKVAQMKSEVAAMDARTRSFTQLAGSLLSLQKAGNSVRGVTSVSGDAAQLNALRTRMNAFASAGASVARELRQAGHGSEAALVEARSANMQQRTRSFQVIARSLLDMQAQARAMRSASDLDAAGEFLTGFEGTKRILQPAIARVVADAAIVDATVGSNLTPIARRMQEDVANIDIISALSLETNLKSLGAALETQARATLASSKSTMTTALQADGAAMQAALSRVAAAESAVLARDLSTRGDNLQQIGRGAGGLAELIKARTQALAKEEGGDAMHESALRMLEDADRASQQSRDALRAAERDANAARLSGLPDEPIVTGAERAARIAAFRTTLDALGEAMRSLDTSFTAFASELAQASAFSTEAAQSAPPLAVAAENLARAWQRVQAAQQELEPALSSQERAALQDALSQLDTLVIAPTADAKPRIAMAQDQALSVLKLAVSGDDLDVSERRQQADGAYTQIGTLTEALVAGDLSGYAQMQFGNVGDLKTAGVSEPEQTESLFNRLRDALAEQMRYILTLLALAPRRDRARFHVTKVTETAPSEMREIPAGYQAPSDVMIGLASIRDYLKMPIIEDDFKTNAERRALREALLDVDPADLAWYEANKLRSNSVTTALRGAVLNLRGMEWLELSETEEAQVSVLQARAGALIHKQVVLWSTDAPSANAAKIAFIREEVDPLLREVFDLTVRTKFPVVDEAQQAAWKAEVQSAADERYPNSPTTRAPLQ